MNFALVSDTTVRTAYGCFEAAANSIWRGMCDVDPEVADASVETSKRPSLVGTAINATLGSLEEHEST